jgi:hypothetical protein
MKLRILSSIFIFISAYFPLTIIFAIQDINLDTYQFAHPLTVWSLLGLSLISCIIVGASVGLLKVSTPPVKVTSVSNRSGELVNYSIPYMISFFVMDLGKTKLLLSFGFFMFIMYWLTLKTHNIFINPVLALLGYNLYDVKYEKNGREYEDFFLIKGERLAIGEQCRIIELSEKLFLVTERNPEV